MDKNDIEIDVCGACCPLPLIKVRKAVNGMFSGQILAVTGDDPIFEASVRDLCEESGMEVLSAERDGRRVKLQIKV